MKEIRLLDCTLRDGGYVNNWSFGKKNIKTILNGLNDSNVEFIEIGYYAPKKEFDENSTLFSNIYDINSKLKSKNNLIMVNYGDADISEIPDSDELDNIFGIRVCFHKNNCSEAIEFCNKLKEKGWNVFVQPMVTMSYSEKEFKELIEKVNEIQPYALYIADSFGTMNQEDVIEKFTKLDKILNDNITIGFHSHNNLQLSYSNVITLLEMNLNRDIIIDSSVHGMGRGAGNLNTELIMKYLINKYKKQYKIIPILEVLDECIIEQKEKYGWGYCLEYYLSAQYNCHPNYARFLSEMHTLTINDINQILAMIPSDKKNTFDKTYIKELYITYLNHRIDDSAAYEKLHDLLKNKKILLLGGGNSIVQNKDEIKSFIDENTIIISLNNLNDIYDVEFIFVSNKRRYKEFALEDHKKIICTSNVKEDSSEDLLTFDYLSNLAKEYETSDNVLLIFLNILIKAKIDNVYLCGFDGFTYKDTNYYSDDLAYTIHKERIDNINEVIKKYIKLYDKKIRLNWITNSKYQEEN